MLIDEDDQQPPVWHRTLLEGQDAFDRTRSLRGRHILYRNDWNGVFQDGVLAVGIEDPAGNHGVRALARVQGAILMQIPDSVLVTPLQPAQWRKLCGLPGNASKEMVRAYGVAAFGGEFRAPVVQDCFDAYCIAVATRALLEQTKEAA